MREGDILCRYCATLGLDELQDESGGHFTLELCKGSYVCSKCKKAFPSLAFRVGMTFRRDDPEAVKLVRPYQMVKMAANTNGLVILPSHKNKQTYWVWEY